MNIELDFNEFREYLHLINIECVFKTGLNKAQSTQALLQALKSSHYALHQDWKLMDTSSTSNVARRANGEARDVDSSVDSEQDLSQPFRVGLYINHAKKLLVIALAGTKNKNDIKPNLEIFRGKIPSRFKQLNDFLDIHLSHEARESYQKLGYAFIFTGHSLGGFLAQLGYVKCKYETPNFQAKVLVFDSPGPKKHALQLLYTKYKERTYTAFRAKELAKKHLNSIMNQDNIINIIRRFNIINTSGQQIGRYIWVAESYLTSEKLNKFKLLTNISYHKLSSFTTAIQNSDRYNIYSIISPPYTNAILVKSAEYNPKSMLLNIKEIQENNNNKKVFQRYIAKIFGLENTKFSYYTDLPVTDQPQEIYNYYFKIILENGFEFIDRSSFLIKIIDIFKGLQGKKKSVDKQQENLLIIGKIIQEIHYTEINPSHNDQSIDISEFTSEITNYHRKSIQTRD